MAAHTEHCLLMIMLSASTILRITTCTPNFVDDTLYCKIEGKYRSEVGKIVIKNLPQNVGSAELSNKSSQIIQVKAIYSMHTSPASSSRIFC